MSKFLFTDKSDSESESEQELRVWRILVVDDDPSVHQVTKLVLNDLEIENRSLELISANSVAEAQRLLLGNDDIAMAFVDVVMETEHAGLDLVRWIRDDLKNQAIRLILRTGQAGQAPEARVIKEFDINGYKEKTDFVANKMISTVYAGIRGYRDIITIQNSLTGAKRLIEASNDMLCIRDLNSFGSAALTHLLTLMEIECSALYIAHSAENSYSDTKNLVIACTGKYDTYSGDLDSCDIDSAIIELIKKAFAEKSHHIGKRYFIGYYETPNHTASVLYIDFEHDTGNLQTNLLDMYTSNVAIMLENLTAHKEVERDLIYIISSALETRSPEAGIHAGRVARLSEYIATKLNTSDEFIHTISIAAAVHDIGMMTIPEGIVKASGQLTEQQRTIMYQHTTAGSQILERSGSTIGKMGARIALSHHENWDGTGYPQGLQGESIPLEARITAVADRFEALSQDRPYRRSWDNDAIKHHLQQQRGLLFDAEIADIVLENFAHCIAMRNHYSLGKAV